MAIEIDHPLGAALMRATEGACPPVDGVAEIVPPDASGTWAVVCFTGHAFVLTDRAPADLVAFAPDGYGRAMEPRLLVELAGAGGETGSTDIVLVRNGRATVAAVGAGTPDDRARLVERVDLDTHPRVERSRRHRRDVRVVGDDRGLVTIGRGLVGRTELSVELTDATPGLGVGRALVQAALREIDAGEPVFAQVAAGNAASLRLFLACGFVPIASEVLIEPG